MESSRLERGWGQEIPHLQKGPDKTELASTTVEIRLISRRLKGSGRGSNLEGGLREVKERVGTKLTFYTFILFRKNLKE